MASLVSLGVAAPGAALDLSLGFADSLAGLTNGSLYLRKAGSAKQFAAQEA